MSASRDFEIENDHFQFFMSDRIKGPLVDTRKLWGSGHAIASMAGKPELVAIPTSRYGGRTRIRIEVVSFRPAPVENEWHELGEFEIEAQSGELLLWSPETDPELAPVVAIPAGTYHGRAYSRGADGVTDEIAADGPDEYRVVLWPRVAAGRV